MAKVTRRAPTDTETRDARVAALASLGLDQGQRVRFRRDPTSRWTEGDATAVEADGSLSLRDNRGRQRSIPIETVQARSRGPRGGRVWVPVADLASRNEQRELVEQPNPDAQPGTARDPHGHGRTEPAEPAPRTGATEVPATSEQLGLF